MMKVIPLVLWCVSMNIVETEPGRLEYIVKGIVHKGNQVIVDMEVQSESPIYEEPDEIILRICRKGRPVKVVAVAL